VAVGCLPERPSHLPIDDFVGWFHSFSRSFWEWHKHSGGVKIPRKTMKSPHRNWAVRNRGCSVIAHEYLHGVCGHDTKAIARRRSLPPRYGPICHQVGDSTCGSPQSTHPGRKRARMEAEKRRMYALLEGHPHATPCPARSRRAWQSDPSGILRCARMMGVQQFRKCVLDREFLGQGSCLEVWKECIQRGPTGVRSHRAPESRGCVSI